MEEEEEEVEECFPQCRHTHAVIWARWMLGSLGGAAGGARGWRRGLWDVRCGCETSGGWLEPMEIEEEGREGESNAKHTRTHTHTLTYQKGVIWCSF